MAQILIVDDDKAVRVITRMMLERLGHSVCCADDGEAALGMLEEAVFDLLMIDIFMPGMDGIETIGKVHRLRPDIPIISISGHIPATLSAPDFLTMSTKLGAICSLRKPFKSAVLLSHIERCLHPSDDLRNSP